MHRIIRFRRSSVMGAAPRAGNPAFVTITVVAPGAPAGVGIVAFSPSGEVRPSKVARSCITYGYVSLRVS